MNFSLDSIEDEVIIRRSADIRFLVSCIEQGSNCILSGPAGIGKTTLLKLVATDAKSISPELKVVWISFRDAFDTAGFMHILLEQLSEDISDEDSGPISQIRKESSRMFMRFGTKEEQTHSWANLENLIFQSDNRYLFIFDDYNLVKPEVANFAEGFIKRFIMDQHLFFVSVRNSAISHESLFRHLSLLRSFQYLYLGPLNLEESAEFIRLQLKSRSLAIPLETAYQIAHLASGHPMLISYIVKELKDEPSSIDENIQEIIRNIKSSINERYKERDFSLGEATLKSESANSAVISYIQSNTDN